MKASLLESQLASAKAEVKCSYLSVNDNVHVDKLTICFIQFVIPCRWIEQQLNQFTARLMLNVASLAALK